MAERVEIRLEVEPESDPIAGHASAGDGARHEFRGWVQLMAAVDAARSVAAKRGTAGWDPTGAKDEREPGG